MEGEEEVFEEWKTRKEKFRYEKEWAWEGDGSSLSRNCGFPEAEVQSLWEEVEETETPTSAPVPPLGERCSMRSTSCLLKLRRSE